MTQGEAPIEQVRARAYRIPTETPEADGTLQWDATVLVIAQVQAAGTLGLGYTYSDACIVGLIQGALAHAIDHREVFDIPGCWHAMQKAVRNLGREGLAATAISAVDIALWDLKAKLLERPLVKVLGQSRESVPIYGSGGFTNYTDGQLEQQLGSWIEREGCRWVKMKVGTEPPRDPHRVDVGRRAIGDHGLFVDANGAYSVKEALYLAQTFARNQVLWFEEPVSADDLVGLSLLRRRAPAAMDIAAGEYGYTSAYFRRMLSAGAVDVQQADVTRCGGITGWLHVASLCEAHHIDLSGHCAPSLHLHAGCAAPRCRHLEWFHDHVRIEQRLFDGAPVPRNGLIGPDLSRPGLGLEFKAHDAERYQL